MWAPITVGGTDKVNVAETLAERLAEQDELFDWLDVFTASVNGLVPAPTASTGKFLRDDGTWATPAGGEGGGGEGVTDGDKGDIVVSSLGSVWTVEAGAITFAKMQDIATNKLLGRFTTSSGDIEEVGIDDSLAIVGGALQRAALTGDVIADSGSNSTTIPNNTVTFAKMTDVNTGKILGRATAGTGDIEELSVGGGVEITGGTVQRSALTGDVTASAGNSATTLGNNVVSNAKFRQGVAVSIVGRYQATDGNVADIVATSDDTFLRRVSGVLSWGLLTLGMIPNALITWAKLQNVSATDRILGRSSAGAGVIEEIACTAAGRALIDDADASAQRTTLGLGSMATQGAGAVAITGGDIAGITDLAVADGGTGAGTAVQARANINKGTVILTDATNIATNCGAGNVFEVTLGGNRTLDNPTNIAPGATYIWIVTQDATGGRTLTLGSAFKAASGDTFSPSAAGSKTDVITAIAKSNNDLLYTYVKGF